MSAELQVVTTHRGAQKILLDGFMYTKKHVSKSADEVVWRCIQRDVKCSARLKTTKSLSDHRLVGEHSHIADRVRCDVEQARQYMKRKAATTNDRPNNILSFTVRELDDQVKARMPRPDTSKRVLRRVRAAHRPKDPQSLQELDITGPWASNLLYDNGPAADERIIVFASPGHLEQLAACDDWCMDGTFSVAPRLFTQLYVVQGRIGEGYFPLAFALLQRKTQTTYEELFRVLEQHGCDPSTVIVDFERPVELGLRAVFGEEIQVRFCFYHLSQSIWRQIQGLGLKNLYESDDEFRLFCGQLDALAFLPTEDVHEGMKHLRSTMPNEAAALVEYFDSTYVSGQLRHQRRVTPTPGRVIQPVRLRRTPPMFLPERWNQHHATLNNEPRTNNICEGWNNKFSSLVGHSNPTIWKLIECLQAEASNVDSVLLQDERGIRPVKRRKKCYAELQTRLCNLVGDLKAGKKTLPEFLRGVSYNLRGGKPNI
ncbi:uncharacterized protein LOC143033764 [Oratosquilla oratoria]|uniref:uncharacterized protein LOC143033764 n=1 Tax=Oratosquilla oratoria TaxID=337810 RepID=UPI003F76EF9F